MGDANYYSRLAAWDVSDMESGEEIAEVRMIYTVCKAPGPIQLPHLSEVRQTQVTLNWSPPLEENGRRVTGYRIRLLEPCKEQWITVCECTQRTHFLVDGLTIGTSYLVNIQAINEVGIGESFELEIATSDGDEPDDASYDDVDYSDSRFDRVNDFYGEACSPCQRELMENREAPAARVPDTPSHIFNERIGSCISVL